MEMALLTGRPSPHVSHTTPLHALQSRPTQSAFTRLSQVRLLTLLPYSGSVLRSVEQFSEPFLTRLEDRMQGARLAISEVYDIAAEQADSSTLCLREPQDRAEATFWSLLKEKFTASGWYRCVDAILLQNSLIRAFASTSFLGYRPAEVFFSTITQEFAYHSQQEEFMQGLQERLGSAWDERLAPLAGVFFSTAKVLTSLLGVPRVVGGALQLGRVKSHEIVDDLLDHWDSVLSLSSQMVDYYLPDDPGHGAETAPAAQSLQESYSRKTSSTDSEEACMSDGIDSGSEEDVDIEGGHMSVSRLRWPRGGTLPLEAKGRDAASIEEKHTEEKECRGEMEKELCPSTDGISHIERLTEITSDTRQLFSTVSARLQRRFPQLLTLLTGSATFALDLKSTLTTAWFTYVDEILMQNVLVRAVLATALRPADHFFNTSLQLFRKLLGFVSDNLGIHVPPSRYVRDLSSKHNATTPLMSLVSEEHEPMTVDDDVTLSNKVYSGDPPPVIGSQLVERFVLDLRGTLGGAWDNRLCQPARSFYDTASKMTMFTTTIPSDISVPVY